MKTWKDVGAAIGKYAPMLGRAVAKYVPGGDIAIEVIKDVADAFGAKQEPDDLAAKIAAAGDPDRALKLREIELAHAETLVRLSQETDAMYLADVQAARKMRIDVTTLLGKQDPMQWIFMLITVPGFFVVVGLAFFVEVPQTTRDLLMILIGNLAASYVDIKGFLFGTSKGSKDKDAALASIAANGK